jgi:hypothetical protein
VSDEKPIIRLWQLTGLGLIIAHPSGVIYSNQTGGYACDHRELEGVFVPLTDPDVDQYAPLDEHFYTARSGGDTATPGSTKRPPRSSTGFLRPRI